jgi:hypothetical protein
LTIAAQAPKTTNKDLVLNSTTSLEVDMLSDKKAMEILNRRKNKYSLNETKIIKEHLEKQCRIEYEILKEKRAKNSPNLLKSL